MTAPDPRFVACHASARAFVERELGVQLERGGVARSLERHVGEVLAGDRRLTSDAYARALAEPRSLAARRLLAASTVTHSWLFRDPAQLDELRRVFVASERKASCIWVAGCASGEEAYTIAAVAKSVGHEARILATDVNEDALERAAQGRYSAWSARELPAWAYRYFVPDERGSVQVGAELRACVELERRSLLEEPPSAPSGAGWHVVSCRNVLIYFQRERAQQIASKLSRSLAPGGLLLLGATDVLIDRPVARRAPVPEVVAAAPSVTRVVLAATLESKPQVAPRASPAVCERAPSFDDVLSAAVARTRADAADADAHAIAGLSLYARGEHQRAIDHFRAAACLEPKAWSAWLFLGLSSERLGHWPEASRALRRALSQRECGVALPFAPDSIALELRASRRQLFDLAEQRLRSLDIMLEGAFRSW